MKKIFALTLSLTLGFALLSCGGSGGSKISEKELAGTIALMDELNVLNQLISTTVAINTSVVEEDCDTSGKVTLNYGDDASKTINFEACKGTDTACSLVYIINGLLTGVYTIDDDLNGILTVTGDLNITWGTDSFICTVDVSENFGTDETSGTVCGYTLEEVEEIVESTDEYCSAFEAAV
jgi:hypothetical protein